MKITFHGASRTVTGSKHIVTLNDGTHLLVDCGMFQGMGQKTDHLNEHFGFKPNSISCVLLSHAHIDHSGLLPKLVKEGFNGPVYCTAATKELTELLLYDSAEIQTYETDSINKTGSQHNLPPYAPLYTAEDVQRTMEQFETVAYNTPFRINEFTEVLYTDAGHLIGSACIHLAITERNHTTRLSFSGDVGRYRSVLLPPPAEFPQADYIVMESTYGATMHDIAFNTIDALHTLIKQTCVVNRGKLIIPAFSVGRTQEVLFALNQLELENRLPEISYYVDSPLSIKATSVIKAHKDAFNEKLQQILTTDDDPFDFKGLQYVESVTDSRKLVENNEPCVIISASGTADAGRVRHHIYNCLKEPGNTIVFVGYCQQQSLGGQLLQGAKTVELFGETCAVMASVDAISTMSAHGDVDDLQRFLSCQDPKKTKGIFLVHGEYAVQQDFAARLERKGFGNIIIPQQHKQFELR